uniref:Uncharacterized protein n=1 Tax=Panagrolaimus sp. PS1159 TaxID=55785 RepID=A0AC35GVY7_9BILA
MFKSNDRSHIIVFENDDKKYAREYKLNMSSNQVECIRCLTANPSKSCVGERNPIDFFLMVPVAENHNCVAFRVIENDKQLPKKTANKRKISNKENEPSIVKKSKASVANIDESAEHENNENSSPEQTCYDILTPPSEVASNISTVESDLASTANSNVIVQNQEFNYVTFYPSDGCYLDVCCTKLKIPYSCEAVNFWSKIEISYIAKDSVPRECHSVSEEDNSAFRCFSFLLSGSEDYYLKLKDTLLPYVCTNIKALGEKHNLDLVRPDSPLFYELVLGRVASKIHFEALAMLLECRIGIFENGRWDRYGNWEENTVDKSCIFLLQKIGDTFGVILSFNN